MWESKNKDLQAEATGKKTGALPGTDTHLQYLVDAGLIVSCDSGNAFIDRVMDTLTRSEGKLNTIAWHDGEHGISVGIAKWNQKKGELPHIIECWAQADPKGFQDTFGHYAARMHHEDFIRKAHITRDSDLGLRMAKMVE